MGGDSWSEFRRASTSRIAFFTTAFANQSTTTHHIKKFESKYWKKKKKEKELS